jgi:hypothetical protein
MSSTAVVITSILSFLASWPLLLFVVCFYKDTVHKDQQRLKSAAGWAVLGFSLHVFMYAGILLVSLRINFLPEIFQSRFLENLMPFIPLASALFFFIFIFFYFIDASHDDKENLHKSLRYALFGASVALVLRLIIIVQYFFNKEIRWFSDLSGLVSYIALPVVFLGVLAQIYFFISFHKGRDLF